MGYMKNFFKEHNIKDKYEKGLIVYMAEDILATFMSHNHWVGSVIKEVRLSDALHEDVDKVVDEVLDHLIAWDEIEELDLGDVWCKSLGFAGSQGLYDSLYEYISNNMMPLFAEAVIPEKAEAEKGTSIPEELWKIIFASGEDA